MTKKKDGTKAAADDTTGTYVFDKKLGKVVKVSSRVPRVSSKGQGGSFDDMPSGGAGDGCAGCPSGGSCGMGGMGGMGGGFGGDF
jgi:hypothetical protein